VQKVVPQPWLVVVGLLLLLSLVPAYADQYGFSNTNFITINTNNNPPTIATPYPSTILVSNLNGELITNLTVTLDNFTHPFPSDVSIILAGPQGQTALLMSDVGGAIEDFPVTNLILTLDDASPYPLPINDSLFSGTFHPTSGAPLFFNFPAPCPAGSANAPSALAVFDGTDPDGAWNLFVVDDFEEVTNGSISGGWSMSVSVGVPLKLAASSGTNVVLSWPAVAGHTFTPQFSPSITNVAWSNILTVPTLISNRLVLTNRVTGGSGVYRLLVN
jgi:subtilisin-like proprotein convertase family protein